MYNTSVAYREAIQDDIRDFRIKGVITTLEDETIEFDDSDVVVGSYKHNASSQPGELFQHGGAVAKDMQIEIFDRDFDDNNPVLKSLSGGTIEPQIGVVLNIEANRNLSYNSDFTKPLTSDWNSHYGTQSIVNNKFTYTVTEQNSNTRVEYVTPILEPGDYTFSMYSKNNSQLVFKNFDGSTYNTKFVSINDDYSLSHTTLKVLEKQQVVIRIYLLDANIGDTLQIDKFKLEEGLFHTDWSEKTELQTVWIPMGKFIIDDFSQKDERMTIRAIDEMVYLDVDYQESNLTYPATLLQIYVNICNDIGIIPRTTSFINSSVVVTEKPTDTTYRNVLQYLAELSGTFAQMHRQGGLELKWYENQLDYEITADDRFEYNKDTFKANIPGVYYNVETGSGNDKKVTKMLVGQEEGALDLSNNKLLLNIVNKNDVINSVYNKINTIEFYPYVSSYVGDPSLDVGDIITQIDTRGNVFASPVTDLSFSFRGNQSIEGKGQDYTVKKFKGGISSAVKQVVEKQREERDRVTNLELATEDVTNMILNTMGGYTTKLEDSLYVHDMPELDDSTKVWKWGLGGFGYTDDWQGDRVFVTGVNASGVFIAQVISAGIITAEQVQTGILSTEDGKSWIDLTNNRFKLGGMSFDGNHFSVKIGDQDLEDKIQDLEDGLNEINFDIFDPNTGEIISLINLAPNSAKIKSDNIKLEGITTINNNFVVNADGSITAKKADINGAMFGEVYADAGRIGSFNIEGDELIGITAAPAIAGVTLTPRGIHFDGREGLINHSVVDGIRLLSPHKATLQVGNYPNDNKLILLPTGKLTLNGNEIYHSGNFTPPISGSNSNGSWVQFEDGTMICYVSGSMRMPALAFYSEQGLYSGYTSNWTFAKEFVGRPYVSHKIIASEHVQSANRGVTNSTVNFSLYMRTDSSNTVRDYNLLAIGRWK